MMTRPAFELEAVALLSFRFPARSAADVNLNR